MFLNLRGAVDELANSKGRTTRHIITGLAITGGAVALSALIARMTAAPPEVPEVYSDYEEQAPPEPPPPPSVFATIWPPLFLALTLSGFRVWNAPRSFARTQALTLWAMVQALNAGWMVLGPRRLGDRVAAAVMSLGTAAVYAWRTKGVDPAAASMVAPYVGWIAFVNLLGEELWRKNLKPVLTEPARSGLFRPKTPGAPAWPRY
jgi:tryptophan-rich sensory protein